MKPDDLIEYLRGRIDGCRLPEDVDMALEYARELEVVREYKRIKKKYNDSE